MNECRHYLIGYVGIVNGKPDFCPTTDDYVGIGEDGVQAANIFKSRREARKRYQQVAAVYIEAPE